jgi:ribose 5-phosphate isomerase B
MAPKKKIILSVACDHAAYDLKKFLLAYLKEEGYEFIDRGARSGRVAVDYPDYALKVVKDILNGEANRGILLCGTGIGMSIAANRFKGVRAAVAHDVTTASLAASHNHANILCLGARLISPYLAKILVKTWLETPFEPRHKCRLSMIDELADKKIT